MLSYLLFGTAQAYTMFPTNQICFDMEAWNYGRRLDGWDDDEVHEDTTCNVCAAEVQNGRLYNKRCVKGLKNIDGLLPCIQMPTSFNEHSEFIVQTDCSDSAWIDQVFACGNGGWQAEFWPHQNFDWCWGHPYKQWGVNDADGWCLSRDRNGHRTWNSDDRAQYVGGNTCYSALGFRQNGHVYGYYGSIFNRRLDEEDAGESDDDMDWNFDGDSWVDLTQPEEQWADLTLADEEPATTKFSPATMERPVTPKFSFPTIKKPKKSAKKLEKRLSPAFKSFAAAMQRSQMPAPAPDSDE